MTGRASGRWEAFPRTTLAALATVLAIDDVVGPRVELPATIRTGQWSGQIRRCFALSRQFWVDTVRRDELRGLVLHLMRRGDLDAARRRRYKDLRASYKDLRAATILYGEPHREPWLLGETVKALGRLQDAYRNHRPAAIRGYGAVVRALLAAPCWRRVCDGVEHTAIDTAGGFAAARRAEVRRLRRCLQQPVFSGRAFHGMRKIASHEVAFRGHLLALGGDPDVRRTFRFLSAVNGLMGQRHDALIEQDLAGAQPYATPTPLPDDIRWRLEAFVNAYPR